MCPKGSCTEVPKVPRKALVLSVREGIELLRSDFIAGFIILWWYLELVEDVNGTCTHTYMNIIGL